MATRAEQYRSSEQRRGGPGSAAGASAAARAKKKRAKKATWSHESHHAGVKAAYALEDTAPGKRPSRESTRRSSNRAKPDAARDITEEVRETAPRARVIRARAKGTKVRGKPRGEAIAQPRARGIRPKRSTSPSQPRAR